ncbi:MAG TPA: 30S ribosomal protein S3 [Candidatus Parcubacteria bacterium]|nr:30S ribosomal protein S3 [Candidatus Parcubacteria bacterium]
MTHKVHPKIYRAKETSDWSSRGFYKEPAKSLEEDFKIRKFLTSKLKKAGIEKIEIERFSSKLNIIVFSSRPGIIIGRGGEGVEQLKKELIKKILGYKDNQKSKKSGKKDEEKKIVNIEIREVRNPWVSASLSAQLVAQQIEKRVNHRRAMKQAISKIITNKEVKGVKVEVSGRLNGVEIARREWLREGRLPLQTIRADIDFAKAEAYCTYGVIGVKVWIYKGEKFE